MKLIARRGFWKEFSERSTITAFKRAASFEIY